MMPPLTGPSKRLLWAGLIVLLGGCAQMSIQVDVLSSDYLASVAGQTALRAQLDSALAPDDATFRRELEHERVRLYAPIFDLMMTKYDSRIAATNNREVKEILQREMAEIRSLKVNDPSFTRLVDHLLASRAQARDAYFALPQARRAAMQSGAELVPPELAARLRAFKAQADRLQEMVVADTDGRLQTLALSPAEARSIQEATSQLQARVASLTGGNTIVGDAAAYAIASAPPSAWAHEFNRTFARGVLGDLDVAVKLQSLGDFTIKGARFDPTDVAKYISKVGVQTVLIAAQMAGVPVATQATPGSAGAALAAGSREIGGQLQPQASAEALRTDYRRALLEFALTITQERDTIKSGNAESRQRVRQAVKNSFDSKKARMTLRANPG